MRKGIYAIVHKDSKKTYVGQSRNIRNRWEQHLLNLELGNHHNAELQEDWDMSHGNPFQFKIICVLKEPNNLSNEEISDFLNFLEGKTIKKLAKERELYNIARIPKSRNDYCDDFIKKITTNNYYLFKTEDFTTRDNYERYQKLLIKYNVRQKAERWSSESYTQETRYRRRKEYLKDSSYLMDRMKLVGNQRVQLQHMVKTIPLKDLHRRLDYERIILCLCIYVRKSYDKQFKWQNYGVVKEYGLESHHLLTVIMNLCIYYNKNSPLPIVNELEELKNYKERSSFLDEEVYELLVNLQNEVEYWKKLYLDETRKNKEH